MEQWQGINWRRGQWKDQQWQQFQKLLNSGEEFHLLGIQYPYLIKHPQTGQSYEVPRYVLPDAHWYKRAAVQYALYEDDQFAIYLSWEAGYSHQLRAWVWIDPPKQDGTYVNAWDFTIKEKGEYDPYPYVVKTSHGNLLKLGGDTVVYPEYYYHLDPERRVTCNEGWHGQTDGGLFIAPPDYQAKLYVNQIRSQMSV